MGGEWQAVSQQVAMITSMGPPIPIDNLLHHVNLFFSSTPTVVANNGSYNGSERELH